MRSRLSAGLVGEKVWEFQLGLGSDATNAKFKAKVTETELAEPK